MLHMRKQALMAKIEATYGTDSVPAAPTNAMLCSRIKIKPIAGSMIERPRLSQFLAPRPQILAAQNVQIDFDMELAGAGAAGTAPLFGPLLRACALSETITGGVKVAYKPVDSAFESVSIRFNQSGIQHNLKGARGNVSFNFPKDDVPRMSFSFLGLDVSTADTAMFDPNSGFIDPLIVNAANTPTCTLAAIPIVMESLSFGTGNKVIFRDRPNLAQVAITDRLPTGQIDFEMVAIATHNFFADAKAGTNLVLALVHGVTAGFKIQVDASECQLLTPDYGSTDDVLTLPSGIRFNGVANPEFTLTVL
jgi:hypothetical protein